MNSAIERLLTLRVRDAMTTGIVSVSKNATMAEAARLLSKHDVRGLPVVDDMGVCVGVLSAVDFARRGAAPSGTGSGSQDESEFVLVADELLHSVEIQQVAEDRVERHMSHTVQSVNDDTTLMDAARMMCAAHIHRVVVLDESGRPEGIVSSLDVAAALVKAIEE